MASYNKITRVLVKCFDNKLGLLPVNHVQATCSANMSQFPKYFIQPTYKVDELDGLYSSGQVQKRVHMPCRPPLNDQTSSLFVQAESRKFTNFILKKGKKELARDLLDKAFEIIKRSQLEKYHSLPQEKKEDFQMQDPNELLQVAINNIKPIMVLTPIKRGGVRYQVPVPISDGQAKVLAYKWLIEAAKDKDSKMRFFNKLALEIMDAASNSGRLVKKKLDLHKQCEANRAYAHYRWG